MWESRSWSNKYLPSLSASLPHPLPRSATGGRGRYLGCLFNPASKKAPHLFSIQASQFSFPLCGWEGWGLLVCDSLDFMTHHDSGNKHKAFKI